MSTPDKETMDNLLAHEQTCRRISAEKGCLYPPEAESLYWLIDTLRTDLIAAHVAAATAKERQARELAEGELVEARKGWAYFAGWSASSQKYEVCHWQGRDSNVPKFDTLEAAWEEAERRSIAARVNGLMPLAPAPAGGEP